MKKSTTQDEAMKDAGAQMLRTRARPSTSKHVRGRQGRCTERSVQCGARCVDSEEVLAAGSRNAVVDAATFVAALSLIERAQGRVSGGGPAVRHCRAHLRGVVEGSKPGDFGRGCRRRSRERPGGDHCGAGGGGGVAMAYRAAKVA